MSVVLAALWRTTVRDPNLLRPEGTEQEIRAITNRATPNRPGAGQPAGAGRQQSSSSLSPGRRVRVPPSSNS